MPEENVQRRARAEAADPSKEADENPSPVPRAARSRLWGLNARLPLVAFCAVVTLGASAHGANALSLGCSATDNKSGFTSFIGFPFEAGETITTTTTDPHILTVTSSSLGVSDSVGPGLKNSYTFTQTGTYTVSAGGFTATWTCSDLPPNATPVAEAGPAQSVASATSVTLDGSASSDGDNDPLTYSWTQISGPPVTLSNASAATPTFTAPTLSVGKTDATLVFSLTVNDGTVDSVADTVTITVIAPTNSDPVAEAGPSQSVASAAAVTLDGSASSDGDNDPLTYRWKQTSGPAVELSDPTTATPTFTAPTLSVGQADVTLVFSLTVNDGTVDSAADTVTITVTAPSPTPATEFATSEDTIRAVIVDDATRSLQSTIASNRRLVRDARARFVYQQQASSDPGQLASRNNVPFDIDGGVEINRLGVDATGTFFQQAGFGDGSTRRLFFGDFDIQHDSETGSSTATLNGSIAWELMVSDKTMLGYFIGGELARSSIDGAFEGEQNRVGVNAGGYAVHQLDETLYLDGFLSFGAGRNNLEMGDGVLDLDSDYTTRTATLGAAVSGIYAYRGYGFRPELAMSYGRTWIGDMDFTGRAFGLVDDTLSLDAGSVTVADVTFRPEVLVPLDGRMPGESISFVSFAPRLICEQVKAVTTEENCGVGAEMGLTSWSEDGLSAFSARIVADRLGDRTVAAFQLNLEHRF